MVLYFEVHYETKINGKRRGDIRNIKYTNKYPPFFNSSGIYVYGNLNENDNYVWEEVWVNTEQYKDGHGGIWVVKMMNDFHYRNEKIKKNKRKCQTKMFILIAVIN